LRAASIALRRAPLSNGETRCAERSDVFDRRA
jgi:hypothetical protein